MTRCSSRCPMVVAARRVKHKLAAALSECASARLAGVSGPATTQRFARYLSEEERRAPGAWRDPEAGRRVAPSDSTMCRVMADTAPGVQSRRRLRGRRALPRARGGRSVVRDSGVRKGTDRRCRDGRRRRFAHDLGLCPEGGRDRRRPARREHSRQRRLLLRRLRDQRWRVRLDCPVGAQVQLGAAGSGRSRRQRSVPWHRPCRLAREQGTTRGVVPPPPPGQCIRLRLKRLDPALWGSPNPPRISRLRCIPPSWKPCCGLNECHWPSGTSGARALEGTDACFAPVLGWTRRIAIRTTLRELVQAADDRGDGSAGSGVFAGPTGSRSSAHSARHHRSQALDVQCQAHQVPFAAHLLQAPQAEPSKLPADAGREKFLRVLGIHGDPVATRKRISAARRRSERFEGQAYSDARAFSHAPDEDDAEWITAAWKTAGELRSARSGHWRRGHSLRDRPSGCHGSRERSESGRRRPAHPVQHAALARPVLAAPASRSARTISRDGFGW